MKTILFACLHNAGRSQITAAWFNALSDPRAAQTMSAGTQPANHVHREVITAMKEVGIDLSSARPQLLTEETARVPPLMMESQAG
jgi:arsenate reductase